MTSFAADPPASDGFQELLVSDISDFKEPASTTELILKDRLDRETDLIIQRTAWVVGSQAFLFSAYAVALGAPAHAATPAIEVQSRLLVQLIPWVSLVSLFLLLVTIGAGVVAWFHLRGHRARSDALGPFSDTGPILRIAGLAAPLLIPVAFLATWLELILHR
jgi:hypothetical protein